MFWASRSQLITNDILKEINNLDSAGRALFYAQLGEAWSEKDKAEGFIYLNKAVAYAISPATVFKDEQEKLFVLRKLLKTIASKDAGLEKKLLTKLTETSSDSSEFDASANGEAVLQTAISLVEIDVQRAHNLGIFTLKQKKPVFSSASTVLFLKIHKKNQVLANSYFAQALEAAATKVNFDFLDNLVRIAFPESIGAQIPPTLNDQLKKRLLGMIAAKIKVEVEEVLEKRRTDCQLTFVYEDDY